MTENPFDALGGAGGFDMNALLQQAQQMQEQLEERPGAAGRDHRRRHRRRRRGDGHRQRHRRAGRASRSRPALRRHDADDLADLGDLIVAAYRDAKAQADALASETLGPLAGGLGGAGGAARPARL